MRYVVLCSVLLWTTLSYAQEPPDLSADEPLTVQVTAEEPALLTYLGMAGQHIRVTTQVEDSDLFDSVLELLTPAGQQLAYSDDQLREDGTLERNAQLLVRLPEDGRYTIRVDSFNGVSTGAVTVELNVLPDFEVTVTEADDRSVITVNMLAGVAFTYPLDLPAAAQVTITARDLSGTIDPILTLRDAAGDMLASNDDHNSADTRLNIFDAQLVDVPLAAPGRYEIEVADFLGRVGTVEVTIQQTTLVPADDT